MYKSVLQREDGTQLFTRIGIENLITYHTCNSLNNIYQVEFGAISFLVNLTHIKVIEKFQ